jgi:BolA protein
METEMIIQKTIQEKLTAALAPEHMLVTNESHLHNVPAEAEYHFNVLIVSKSFEGKSLIQRHRAVNEALAEELKEAIHALTMHTLTPEEWAKKKSTTESPPCMGGQGS